jgi:hypothetical protein
MPLTSPLIDQALSVIGLATGVWSDMAIFAKYAPITPVLLTAHPAISYCAARPRHLVVACGKSMLIVCCVPRLP